MALSSSRARIITLFVAIAAIFLPAVLGGLWYSPMQASAGPLPNHESIGLSAEGDDPLLGAAAATNKAVGPKLYELSLTKLRPSDKSVLIPDTTGLHFRTLAQRWSYALLADLPTPPKMTTKAIVRIKIRVDKGLLGFATASVDNHSTIVTEVAANSSTALQTIDLNVPDLSKVGYFIIRNRSSLGASEGTVYSIEVYSQE